MLMRLMAMMMWRSMHMAATNTSVSSDRMNAADAVLLLVAMRVMMLCAPARAGVLVRLLLLLLLLLPAAGGGGGGAEFLTDVRRG